MQAGSSVGSEFIDLWMLLLPTSLSCMGSLQVVDHGACAFLDSRVSVMRDTQGTYRLGRVPSTSAYTYGWLVLSRE